MFTIVLPGIQLFLCTHFHFHFHYILLNHLKGSLFVLALLPLTMDPFPIYFPLVEARTLCPVAKSTSQLGILIAWIWDPRNDHQCVQTRPEIVGLKVMHLLSGCVYEPRSGYAVIADAASTWYLPTHRGHVRSPGSCEPRDIAFPAPWRKCDTI